MIIGIDFDNTIACHRAVLQENRFGRRTLYSKGGKTEASGEGFLSGQEKRQPRVDSNSGESIRCGTFICRAFRGLCCIPRRSGSLGHKVSLLVTEPFSPLGARTSTSIGRPLNGSRSKASFSPDSLPLENCFFEISLEKKIERIERENCSIFIDDLDHVLEHSEFPTQTQKVLFGKKPIAHCPPFCIGMEPKNF